MGVVRMGLGMRPLEYLIHIRILVCTFCDNGGVTVCV